MENHSKELVHVRKMMHQNMFQDENIDINQVMKDVYDNLNSFYEIILLSESYIDIVDLKTMIRPVAMTCNSLITFFRCTLKWCVASDGTINTSLVDTLTDVEYHLLAVTELVLCCARVSSDKDLWPPKQCFEELAIIDNLVDKIAEVYPVVLTALSSPFSFVIGEASVVRLFNQVTSIMYHCFNLEQLEGQLIMSLYGKLFFLREYFLFVKHSMSRESCEEFFVCLEAALDKVACYSFLLYFCSSNEQFESLICSHMRIGTLKALVLLLDSCPVFSDKLLADYVGCVQQNLIELLKDEADDLTVFVKNQIEVLYDEFGLLVRKLVNYQTDSRYKQEMLFAVRIHVQIYARDVGAIICTYLLNREMNGNGESEMTLELSDWPQKVRAMRNAADMNISQAAFIRSKTYKIKVALAPPQTNSPVTVGNEDPIHMSFQKLVRIADDSNNTGHLMSQALVPSTDVFVGFEEEMDLIREQLAGDLSKLDVVSIIGMAGLGKTTLAKKVYEDPCIVERFDVRAWCNVSQEYHKRELLLNIFGSIDELSDQTHEMDDEDLSLAVYKQLKGKRYLIVLDDIWGIEVYEDLKQLFPDDDCGSRVMLTSRNKSISLKAKRYSDPLELRFLTDEESWDLLEQKLYPKQECPLELCEAGKQVAQKCGGLPLAVVLVAGVLSKSDKNKDFWEQVAQSLIMHIAGDSQRQGMAAFELSYELLPDHLKSLFLYVGAFPEDREIPVKKLIWLWIAEGFVKSTEITSLEDQAEINLTDLIDRSLVIVAERRSNGRVKSCRVHDLLRDMCLVKAKEKCFLQQLHATPELPDCEIYQPRLSINAVHDEDEIIPLHGEEDPSIPYFRTISITPSLHSFLLFDKKASSLGKWEEAIKSLLHSFKLLKILHFENIDFDEALYCDLTRLVDLRYLAIQATHVLPSGISGLSNLEALIVKGLKGEIKVPNTIWEMVKLRHLHIDGRASFRDLPEQSSKLENLVTLSTPALEGNEKKLINLIPNLRKLRCIFLDPPSSYEFPDLSSLRQLETLKVLYHGSVPCSCLSNLPSTLKKISLSKFNLQWVEILRFQNLPNLEVLKLRLRAVSGELWDMKEEPGFPKLRFLKLEGLNIKQWSAFANHFPCLEKLVLQRCKQLKNLPDLGDFYSLQRIEVLWCNSYLANLVKLIKDEQEDLGHELLKVYIHPPVYTSSDQGQIRAMDLRYIHIPDFHRITRSVSPVTLMRLALTYKFTDT